MTRRSVRTSVRRQPGRSAVIEITPIGDQLPHDERAARRMPQLSEFRARCAARTERDLSAPPDLPADLARTIRADLRRQASPAHVPSLILPVPALPLTHNGKKSERAARYVLDGEPVANLTALRNPETLDGIARALTDAERDAAGAVAAAADGVAATVGRLWRETLGPTADDQHTFTDLGGTSRQALTLVRQVRQVLVDRLSLLFPSMRNVSLREVLTERIRPSWAPG